MSYRVAHVRFTKSGRTYPVNCHRRDLCKGDIVVVEMTNERKLKLAEFDNLEYLNWNCTNTIMCRKDELKTKPSGDYFILRGKNETIDTFTDLANALLQLGWNIYKPTSSVWYRAFAHSQLSISGAIAMRKNGIDFQIFETDQIPGIVGENIHLSINNGHFIRNWFYASETDLFDHTIAFAKELKSKQPMLDPYFKGIGRKPHPPLKPLVEQDGLREIRHAINGDMSGPAYLSDDVWI